MYRYLFAASMALCGSAVVAQANDNLESTECRQALEALQAQEAAVVAARRAPGQSDGHYQRAPDSRLEKLRRRAALACLGGRVDLPVPASRFAQPPIVVAPIAVARPVPPPPLPIGPAGPLLKPAAPTPMVVTSCDPLGCWANDGSRLIRVGPDLLGPRGFCSVQGTLVHCP
jgi:hypothetical protein